MHEAIEKMKKEFKHWPYSHTRNCERKSVDTRNFYTNKKRLKICLGPTEI